MPKVFERNIGWAHIALWHITESVDEFATLCTRGGLKQITCSSRLREHLAWCTLLGQLSPNSVATYNNVGAPTIDNGYISVSHTHKYALLVLSDTPCGADIESLGRNFAAVASRYISADEMNLKQSNEPLFGAAIWCAKEAMYKLSGRNELDFIRDIHIDTVDFTSSTMSAKVGPRSVKAEILLFDEHIVVVCRGVNEH